MKEKKFEMDMCSGPILSKMIRFALPLIASSMLQLLFNAADVIVVGKFAGDNSLGAVGCTGSIINLLINIFFGLSLGVNVMVARSYGAKHEDELKKTVHTGMLLSVIGGIFLTIAGVIFADNLLEMMNTPKDILPLAATYLRIYFAGMISNLGYNFGASILRAVGDTKRPMYYLAFAGVVNVALNLVFVICFEMDVAGVALATIISQTISFALVVRCLIKEKGAVHLNLRELAIDRKSMFAIMRIGIPAGVQGAIFSISNVVIQSSINGFGEIAVSGNSAASNLEGFVYVAINACYQATLNFVSQNFGAGKFDRIKKIIISGLSSTVVIGIVLGLIEVVFARGLLSFYTSSESVIEAGAVRLLIICSTYFTCGLMDTMVGVLRGIGYSLMPMIVSLLGACGLRLLWIATVFQIPEFHTIETVYMSYPISWTLTFSVHLICFFVVKRKVFKPREA